MNCQLVVVFVSIILGSIILTLVTPLPFAIATLATVCVVIVIDLADQWHEESSNTAAFFMKLIVLIIALSALITLHP